MADWGERYKGRLPFSHPFHHLSTPQKPSLFTVHVDLHGNQYLLCTSLHGFMTVSCHNICTCYRHGHFFQPKVIKGKIELSTNTQSNIYHNYSVFPNTVGTFCHFNVQPSALTCLYCVYNSAFQAFRIWELI